MNPFEFLDLFLNKPRVLELSVGEDSVILACIVFIQCQHVTDGQIDRQLGSAQQAVLTPYKKSISI